MARSIALGTNVPDSISAALNREAPNMVQGVIVFSDMRSNLGSDASYNSLRTLAASTNIPIFTIGIGSVKQTTSINITEILADDAVSNQGSKITVEADGIGLNGQSVPVSLDLYLPGMDPKGEPAYTLKTMPKERNEPTARPATITFTGADTPHGKVQFALDPAQLAVDPDPKARNLVTESTTGAFKRPVLKDGKWLVKAHPASEKEVFSEPEHVRELPITVVSKKIRVLLIADAPTREFQFLRTFLNREVQENRAVLTLLVQNEAGMTNNLTVNATETVIQRFPTKLDISGNKTVDPKEKPYNLNEYDVIVAFDPNWKEVSQQQAEDLKLWVERQGGGFIFVPDRINTEQLARIDKNAADGFGTRLLPILEILPALPDDPVTISGQLPPPRFPRRLYMHPIPDNDLLKIDDPPPVDKKDAKEKEPANDPIAGWELYFTNRDKYVENKDDKIELYPSAGSSPATR